MDGSVLAILAAISLLAIAGAALVTISRRTPPSGERAAATQDNASDLEAQIRHLEARAAELEHMLQENPDQDLPQEDGHVVDDASEVDWMANSHGPGFLLGPADITLLIEYESARGRESRREITVERYSYEGQHGTISAHCHLRGERRTFLFSRIISAADPNSGAGIDNLGQWLDAQFYSSELGAIEIIWAEHLPALNALFYVAKADGAFRASERAIMRQFLEGFGASSVASSIIVEEVAKQGLLSAISYGKELKKLSARAPDYNRQVKIAATSMIESDKTAMHKETLALNRLLKELPG